VFRDDAQAARAIRSLLGTLGLEDLWSDKGPNQSAVALRRDPRRALSPAQDALFNAAWALWDRASPSKIRFDELLRHLDRSSGTALFTLVAASLEGPDAVDRWITEVAPLHARRGPAAVDPLAGPLTAGWIDELARDWPTLDVLSLRYIRVVIERQQGNQARAADILGVDRRTVTRVLAKVRSGRVPSMQTRR
jgi:hypothetical protein